MLLIKGHGKRAGINKVRDKIRKLCRIKLTKPGRHFQRTQVLRFKGELILAN